MRVVLGSTSPARLMLLRSSGIEPELASPGIDETAAVNAESARLGRPLEATETVSMLARLKAEAVARGLGGEPALVIGGDSVFAIDGDVHGKPRHADIARQRWQQQRGRTGVLHTGHWLIDTATGRGLGAVDTATVTFASDLDDAEIEAYLASGEPLSVAGAFTLDSLGSAFIDRIHGHPSTVVGMSLPVLRRLVRELGHEWTDLWSR